MSNVRNSRSFGANARNLVPIANARFFWRAKIHTTHPWFWACRQHRPFSRVGAAAGSWEWDVGPCRPCRDTREARVPCAVCASACGMWGPHRAVCGVLCGEPRSKSITRAVAEWECGVLTSFGLHIDKIDMDNSQLKLRELPLLLISLDCALSNLQLTWRHSGFFLGNSPVASAVDN